MGVTWDPKLCNPKYLQFDGSYLLSKGNYYTVIKSGCRHTLLYLCYPTPTPPSPDLPFLFIYIDIYIYIYFFGGGGGWVNLREVIMKTCLGDQGFWGSGKHGAGVLEL